MILSITKRAKKYGYVIWQKDQDQAVRALLSDQQSFRVYLQGSDRGQKNVDWGRRRISIGYKWTRQLPENLTNYHLEVRGPELHITCR